MSSSNTTTTTEPPPSSNPSSSQSYAQFSASTQQKISQVESQFSSSSDSTSTTTSTETATAPPKFKKLFEGLEDENDLFPMRNQQASNSPTTNSSIKNGQQQQQQTHAEQKPLLHTQRFRQQYVIGGQLTRDRLMGQQWLNKPWIPKMKYRVGREFAKFFMYLLFPFAVVLVTSQPAIQEYLIMRGKHKNMIKSTEEMRTLGDYFDEDQGEDNTYFDLQEKNKRRVDRFLKLQNASRDQEENE